MTQRDAKGRWPAGVSGNKGGRPKAVHRVTELAQSYSEMAIEQLARLARGGDDPCPHCGRGDGDIPPQTRGFASDKLLDRAVGKAPQTLDVTHNDNRPARERSSDELQRIIDEHEAGGAAVSERTEH